MSAGLLGVLVWQAPHLDPADVVPVWSARTVVWLAVAAALTLAAVALATWRWYQVLSALGLRPRGRRLLSHTLAGQFVSNVLPTTIGGDVVRVRRLARENGQAPTTFASVVLERVSGWLVLPVITLVGLSVNPGLRALGTATVAAAVVATGTLVLLVLLVLGVSSPRFGGCFARREGWQRFATALHTGLLEFRRRPGTAVSVLVAGFAYQIVLVLAAVAAARALGLQPAGLTALLAFLPAVLIVQVLPIGISGLGVREGAFVLFLGPLGVATEEAIALGLLLYLLNLGVSLLGAPAFAVGAPAKASAELD